MLNKILILISTLILTSCQSKLKEQYSISGTIFGIENGKKIYIELHENKIPINFDSTVVENGEFKFKGKIYNTDLAFIKCENENFTVPFILEEGKIKLKIDIDTISNSFIKGTYNNDVFQEFNNKVKEITIRKNNFEKFNFERIKKAKKEKDKNTVKMILKEYESYENELNNFSVMFISEHNKAYISLHILENLYENKILNKDDTKKQLQNFDPSLLKTKKGKQLILNLKM